MAGTVKLRPITEAEIAVVPWRDRVVTLAGSGVRLRPTLRSVETAIVDPSGYADNGVMVAMFARLGCDAEKTLVGSVMVSEQARYAMAGPTELVVPRYERLIVIDGLAMTDVMARWRPPLRTLLVSTAAMMVATTAHDGAARTCVACRVERDDVLGSTAVAALGAKRIDYRSEAPPAGLLPGATPIDDLTFLDAAGAARAAELVIQHLDGEVRPARSMSLGRGGMGEVEGMLSLRFPRSIRALREEVECIARGAAALDWRPPAIAMNDLDLHLRRAANAGQ